MAKKARPTDINQLAKAIVDEAVGNKPEENADETARKAAAALLGSKGGKKGGPARAEALTPSERSEIARKAARARWGDKSEG